MSTFDIVLTAVLVLATLTFWGIALRNAAIRRRNKLKTRTAAPVAPPAPVDVAVINAASAEVAGWAALREIMPVLAAPAVSVRVNGKFFLDGTGLIARLRNLQHPTAQASHALAPFPATIETARGQVELWLGRDSDNREDYWVFYPRFDSTRAHPIGHIFTDLLDAFEASPVSSALDANERAEMETCKETG